MLIEWCCRFINYKALYRTSTLNEKYDGMLYMFQKFAGEGLRTLCLAVRDLDEMFFNDWKHRHQEAALSLDNRDEKLDAIYEEIERDMTLIGEWLLPKKECRFFFVIKPTRCTNFTNLFWHESLRVSDSSSVHHQEFILCTLSDGICHTGL